MDKKFLVFLIPLISVITIFGIFAMFSQPVIQPTVISQGFKPVTGAYISVIRESGEREDLGWFNNVFTDAGKNATRDILAYQIYYGNFSYIGLCNSTAGCTAGAGDTSIDNEYTTSGLSRTAGTVNTVTSSPGNWTVYYEFTATANGLSTNMTGLLNQSSGGTLLAVVLFTETTLQNNDQLLVNWTATAT